MEVVLPDPDRGDAAARRLPLHAGLGLARRGDRGDAVRPAAHRPASTGWSPCLDELQVGAASLARLLGVAAGPRRPRGQPASGRRASSSPASDVRFSYLEGRDVLHGVDLRVGAGERLAMVGPVGRGQVDARPVARRHPRAAHRLGDGRRRRLVELPLEELRGHVALVTQEHHVFVGHAAREPRAGRASESDGRAGPRGARRRRRARCGSTRCPTGWTPRSAPAATR